MPPENFVSINESNLKGSNFYWGKAEQYGITKDELKSIGLTDDRVLLHQDLIKPLLDVEDELQKQNYRLFIKEGYRSKELYKLVYQKRVVQFGKEKTDSLMNISDMPHAMGKSVDVVLLDLKTNTEVSMRDPKDGTDALFTNFYRDRTDKQSQEHQRLQDLLINIMQKHGFRLGKLREYFHFDYRPDVPKNY